jgi:death on curing protein
MKEPLWITLEQALFLHKKMIDMFGGANGLRDEGLLQSALARPLNIYTYQEGDLFECAAAYAEGIAHNHPFIDGNKRTAFTVAGMFLRENGLFLKVQQDKNHENAMVALAEKKLNLSGMAKYFKEQTN